MKVESFVFVALAAFVAVITPVYWLLARDPEEAAELAEQ